MTEDYTRMSFAELRARNFTRKLPPDDLKQRIVRFLKSCNICVLATSKDGVPRATPIEYYADGTTLYLNADEGTKLVNIRSNPRVSVGIYNTPYTNWVDWSIVKGMQITGRATLITERSPEYLEAFKIYNWYDFAKAAGRDLSGPPRGRTLIKLIAEKIEYRDMSLLKEGCSRFQTWQP